MKTNTFIEDLKRAGEAKHIIHSGENTWGMDYVEVGDKTINDYDESAEWYDFLAVRIHINNFPDVEVKRIDRDEWWISEYRYIWRGG